MNPDHPYQPHHSSGAAQGGDYHPIAPAAPASTESGPMGEAYSAPYPGQQDSYGGRHTGQGGSYGGSQIDYGQQYGYHHQPGTQQRSYGDDLGQYNFDSDHRSRVAPNVYNTFSPEQIGNPQQYGSLPPGYGGQYMPPPSTSQNFPSVAAVNEPANPGTSGYLVSQDPQASGNQAPHRNARDDVRRGWPLRHEWIYSGGERVDNPDDPYTEAQFRREYQKHWRDLAVEEKDLMEEYKDLRFSYLGWYDFTVLCWVTSKATGGLEKFSNHLSCDVWKAGRVS